MKTPDALLRVLVIGGLVAAVCALVLTIAFRNVFGAASLSTERATAATPSPSETSSPTTMATGPNAVRAGTTPEPVAPSGAWAGGQTPPPAPLERCHTANLSLSLDQLDPGAGNVYATFHFVNETDVPCSFYGYPGAELQDAAGTPLPTQVIRSPDLPAGATGPIQFTVPPHGSAAFIMHWGQVPVGDERVCPEAAQIAIIPPDETMPLSVDHLGPPSASPRPLTVRACGQGRLRVGPVLPG
jgi:hypothetical protein